MKSSTRAKIKAAVARSRRCRRPAQRAALLIPVIGPELFLPAVQNARIIKKLDALAMGERHNESGVRGDEVSSAIRDALDKPLAFCMWARRHKSRVLEICTAQMKTPTSPARPSASISTQENTKGRHDYKTTAGQRN